MPDMASKEAITYGREILVREVERLRQGELEFKNKGDEEKAARWRFAAFWIEFKLLGYNGCVVTPFNERWLDDDFRKCYEEALSD